VVKFSFQDRLRSFRYAFRGLYHLLKHEHNSRIHLVAAICATGMGLVFKISAGEWLALVLVIALVFITEIINTSIEKMVDLIKPVKDSKAGLIKDLASASVLMAATAALITGLIIFLPKII
jgi:diacylglycerol kinase